MCVGYRFQPFTMIRRQRPRLVRVKSHRPEPHNDPRPDNLDLLSKEHIPTILCPSRMDLCLEATFLQAMDSIGQEETAPSS